MPKSKLILIIAFVVASLAGTWWYLHNRPGGRVVTGLTSDPADTLVSVGGRTNVVFLGVGGEGHAGGDLTDSIILFSYAHSTRQVTLIPIPRDLWVKSLQAKINSAYHYGNERREGGGRDLVKSAVAEVTGQSVQYSVVLDFAGFEKMIDSVGGVDLTIDTTFTDNKYPIPGKETALPESDRYEILTFVAGPTHLDGATALKFARSRHAEGEEGTDFARSARQEKVILALKTKLLSTQTLLSLSTLQNLLHNLSDSLDTDIGEAESGAFIRLFLSYAQANSKLTTIDITGQYITPKNLSPYQGQWVLIPKTNQEDIYAYVAKALQTQ